MIEIYCCLQRTVIRFLAVHAVLVILVLVTTAVSVYGDTLPRIDPTGRSGDKRPEVLEEVLPQAPPSLTVPSQTSEEKEPSPLPLKSIFVRKIMVTGSTVFSEQEIAALTTPYENRTITMEDMETLRRALTILYINKGYVNSGAVIPDQTVADGVITLQIIEGKLTHIDVEGNKWFGEAFLRDRIAMGAGTPVNISPLQSRLQLLQQDQRIERIHAELKPGSRPGESELKVTVEEKPPFSAWLAFNNYQSPSVGGEQGLLTLMHQNLTGHADILNLTYGRSEGLKPMIDAWYSAPFTVYDTSLLLRYRKNDNDIVDKTFKPLDIVDKSESYEVALRQPLYRTLNQELALSLGIEHERDKTFMAGEPFSFYPGVDDGEYVVNPMRFSQEWTYRTQRQVFAVRSRFTFGLATEDATINHDNLPDGRFIAWLGQFQWAQILEILDTQLLFRTDAQFADDSLLPIEQISVGGRYSVRGYRENLLVRDQAIIASLEARVPIVRNMRWADYIQVCPFSDYGWTDNKRLPTGDPNDIASAGIGLRWAATLTKSTSSLKAESEIYWGHPFTHVDLPDDDLQDNGIHYQIAITGFF
jgi:hemolysin activation/secretion protein